ncbi:type I phosphodiesterase/nucleotide pyrophosphatase [Pontibacter mucosus]|uniref:Type I phosphodiesterase/nucleotide pyrophosphatase n=1 Tax=Pontibacter mucosus TaxID=1649266 RepID=A0A2T5YP16_9BACT|nr:alkaline phosphatase family protein [Pontibacter mucosus]PTX21077.1 type I phosphodiesterase/nucleotide pyrophosphatase [Pontibacter mucosus]
MEATGIGKYSRCGRALLLLLLMVLAACTSSPSSSDKPKTEYVIILVIDGTRMSETWDSVPGLIPNMSTVLKPKGAFLPNFLNDAYTYTNSGHAAITTGVNQPIDNYGDEFPANPSIFQYFLKQSGKPATAAWIVSSKDKLHILANTSRPGWENTFQPSVNAGVNGPGTGYRMDSLTLIEVKRILTTHKPNLMLINFMEPDGFAHAANWPNYLRGISRDDRYAKELWDFLNEDETFRGKTTLFITADHGRHLNGIDGGFVDHGDSCPGCQQIYLLAMGPDFRRGTVETRHTLIDLAPTVARLLHFTMDSLVVVPRVDTTYVTSPADSAQAALGQDSIRLEIVMDTTVLKARVIEELFK